MMHRALQGHPQTASMATGCWGSVSSWRQIRSWSLCASVLNLNNDFDPVCGASVMAPSCAAYHYLA